MFYTLIMIITCYIFIFWLRKPAAFQDDFWNLLLNIWIIGYSIIAQGISYLMSGRYTIYYYICTGKNPLPDENIPIKSGLHLQILSLIVLLLHILVSLRTYFYKQKIEPKPKQQIRPLYSTEKDSLSDLTTSVGIVLASSFVTIIIWKMNQIKMTDFNCYPNYLYEYFFRMIAPNLFSSIVVLLHFKRNPKFRATIKNEYINFFHSYFY